MNICGVLVHANPSRLDDVIERMRELEGLQVHEVAPGGRVVVTLEDTETSLALDGLTAIHKLNGIIAASLVYHSFEPGVDAA